MPKSVRTFLTVWLHKHRLHCANHLQLRSQCLFRIIQTSASSFQPCLCRDMSPQCQYWHGSKPKPFKTHCKACSSHRIAGQLSRYVLIITAQPWDHCSNGDARGAPSRVSVTMTSLLIDIGLHPSSTTRQSWGQDSKQPETAYIAYQIMSKSRKSCESWDKLDKFR